MSFKEPYYDQCMTSLYHKTLWPFYYFHGTILWSVHDIHGTTRLYGPLWFSGHRTMASVWLPLHHRTTWPLLWFSWHHTESSLWILSQLRTIQPFHSIHGTILGPVCDFQFPLDLYGPFTIFMAPYQGHFMTSIAPQNYMTLCKISMAPKYSMTFYDFHCTILWPVFDFYVTLGLYGPFMILMAPYYGQCMTSMSP